MDRDIALQIVADLTATKNALQLWATCSVPTEPDSNRSIPGDAQRAAPAEDPEELEAPEEEPEAPEEEPESVPETTTRKRTTSK